jgi:hypothetical protein
MKTLRPAHLYPPLHLPRHYKAPMCKVHRLYLPKEVYHLLIQVRAARFPLNKNHNREANHWLNSNVKQR